jgi:hypothetical protein
MGSVETVKIQAKTKQGFMIINKADMKKTDKLYAPKKAGK